MSNQRRLKRLILRAQGRLRRSGKGRARRLPLMRKFFEIFHRR